MTWFKVDDSFYSHPKVMMTSPGALGLWVVAGTWSAANLTDGFVSVQALPRLLPDSADLAEELVTVGLWKRAKGGYQFHDWAEYQPSKADVMAERQKWAEKKAKQRAAKALDRSQDQMSPGDTPGDSDGDSSGESQGSRTRSRVPKGTSSGTAQAPAKNGTLIADDFWMTADMIAWGKEKTPQVNGTRETEKFVNYWKSKTGRDATKKDWVRTWKNWMLTAQERAEENAARRGENTARVLTAETERCPKHKRESKTNCQICDSEKRGAA